MADELELGSDEWFADHLMKALAAEYPRLAKAKSYRDGTNPIVDLGIGSSVEAYAQIVQMGRLNMAEQIANAIISKCRFTSFRTAATDDEDGDEVAGKVANRNRLMSQYAKLADSKATYGRGYMTVLEPDKDAGEDAVPTIVVTDAWRTITMQDTLRPWETRAAVTIGWNPETSTDSVILFRAGATPDEPGYMRRITRFDEGGRSIFPPPGVDASSFSVDLLDGVWEWEAPVRFEKILGAGVVMFDTRDGFGVFEKHYDSLDRVNTGILNRIIITVMQAFKQRAIEGGEWGATYPEGHPKAGLEIDFDEMFKTGPDALWMLPKDAKMWESGVVSITPLVEAEKSDLRNLAAVTGTPLYVLDPASASGGSASGADLAREQHISNVIAWRDDDGGSFAQVMAYAMLAMGEESRAAVEEISVMWLEMSVVTPEAKGSAAKMMRDAGFSTTYIGEKVLGMTPAELRRERESKQVEGFALGRQAPAPASSGGPGSGMPPRAGGAVAGGR